MFAQSQLPVLVIVYAMILFLVPTLIVAVRRRLSLSSPVLGILIISSLLLTLLSMNIGGSRGGEPPAVIYGWPKQIIEIRPGHPVYFFFAAAVVDYTFYFLFLLGLYNLRRILLKSLPLS
jgi:hypothetical protein